MDRQFLVSRIKEKKNFLCVGLDTDADKIPDDLKAKKYSLFEFNRRIIDETIDYCVAYKINTAFYEAQGSKGWEQMQKTVEYIPSSHFKIADAKRGDIGNTSHQYAKAFFVNMPFDAITVSPYMGNDSVTPFLSYKDKWTIVLALTSNVGSKDFEQQKIGNNLLYESVIKTVASWGTADNLMFVVGATKALDLKRIREIIPNHFILIPGVGAQGGSMEDVVKYGLTGDGGLLVNVSREIIYAGNGKNFAKEAGKIAKRYDTNMKSYL
ncbi:MAG: orotidine-5'-phosphate decarboxylase [Bacteroidetes bacterium]|nr:orotidine-5'-phosphate decarboxylase [Bacteroidota bacterium]